jgi:hypothetical protein
MKLLISYSSVVTNINFVTTARLMEKNKVVNSVSSTPTRNVSVK